MLALVHKAQTPCWPWELRQTGNEHPIGATCACGRDVALERSLKGREGVCLYCALDSGLLPAVEIEPDDERSLHAIATEAHRAATVEQGAVHEGAGRNGIAQGPSQ